MTEPNAAVAIASTEENNALGLSSILNYIDGHSILNDASSIQVNGD